MFMYTHILLSKESQSKKTSYFMVLATYILEKHNYGEIIVIYKKYIYLLNQMIKIHLSYIFGLCCQFLAHSFRNP